MNKKCKEDSMNRKNKHVKLVADIYSDEDLAVIAEIEKFGKIRGTDLFRHALKVLLEDLRNNKIEAYKLLK